MNISLFLISVTSVLCVYLRDTKGLPEPRPSNAPNAYEVSPPEEAEPPSHSNKPSKPSESPKHDKPAAPRELTKPCDTSGQLYLSFPYVPSLPTWSEFPNGSYPSELGESSGQDDLTGPSEPSGPSGPASTDACKECGPSEPSASEPNQESGPSGSYTAEPSEPSEQPRSTDSSNATPYYPLATNAPDCDTYKCLIERYVTLLIRWFVDYLY